MDFGEKRGVFAKRTLGTRSPVKTWGLGCITQLGGPDTERKRFGEGKMLRELGGSGEKRGEGATKKGLIFGKNRKGGKRGHKGLAPDPGLDLGGGKNDDQRSCETGYD